MSGTKSKVDQMCYEYELGRQPDLTRETPTNIACVLKTYLRQLPESLFPSTVYDEMVEVGKVNYALGER